MARRKKYGVSKLEKEILLLLQEHGCNVVAQYAIEGLPYLYDFYFPKTKTILEVQGDYWHCNPIQYKAGSLVKIRGIYKPVLVEYIWQRDKLKQDLARQQGFRVVELWEKDYKLHGWTAVVKAVSDAIR